MWRYSTAGVNKSRVWNLAWGNSDQTTQEESYHWFGGSVPQP